MKRYLLVLSLAFVCSPGVALAADPNNEELFTRASTALEKSKYAQAIQDFETLADQAEPHPDLAYNRGMAYALRSRSASAVSGDLGRAAAGFEEALRLNPRDGEAEKALELVRAEVTRRRSKLDKKDALVRPSLDRVIVGLLPVAVWAYLAIGFAVLFGVGLVLRQRARGALHVAGAVAAPLALLACLVLVPLAIFARELDLTTRPAVVVAPETTLSDAEGKPLDAPPLPEASLVEIGARKGDTVAVRWGSYEGFLPADHLRPLLVK